VVDVVVVGQGLAGTALAWRLRRRGRSVLVIDREAGPSASRVAAGLVTPVTGKRLAKSWRWDELFPAAVAFYRAAEAETGDAFFRRRPALRLFADEAERDAFGRRAGSLGELVRAADDVPEAFAAPLGGFEMGAARLDVPRYLAASRDHLRRDAAYLAADVDPASDIALTPAGATYTWEPLDAEPTAAGRAEIEGRLREFLRLPFEVVGHAAAVRPVVDAGVPVLGRHPDVPQLAYFNGLGSKGALLAPFFADQLAAALTADGEVEAAVDVRRHLARGAAGG
jgi:glycine/D-amino acid oxidase-like deaminating enzyme